MNVDNDASLAALHRRCDDRSPQIFEFALAARGARGPFAYPSPTDYNQVAYYLNIIKYIDDGASGPDPYPSSLAPIGAAAFVGSSFAHMTTTVVCRDVPANGRPHCGIIEKEFVMMETVLESSDVEAQRLNEKGIHASQCCTINAPAHNLYQFWRQLENLPRFMAHLKSVTSVDQRISHWKAKAPFGQEVQWDAEIISEEPGRLIAWRSLLGADVQNAGSVRFVETEDRGTEVHVVIQYIPPAGKFGNMLAKLVGEDPSANLREDLRRFKQLMETGEMATPAGPRGACGHNTQTSTEGDGK